MLAMVILFQFIAKFSPFGDTFGGAKFNLTFIFILLEIYVVNMRGAVFLLIARFIIGPALNVGYTAIEVIGQISVLLLWLLIIFAFFVFTKINKKEISRLYQIIYVCFAILLVSFIVSLLNGVLILPWFMAVISNNANWSLAFSIPTAIAKYKSDNWRFMFFYIPNYWGGVIATYISFNIINLTINLLIFIPLMRIAKQLKRQN